MNDAARPIWITLDTLDRITDDLLGSMALGDELREQWESAPADSVEAVKRAIYSTPGWYAPSMIAPVVLRSLGMPDA